MKLKTTLKGHTSGIYKLLVEDKILFSASGDGMVAAWDLTTFEPAPFSIKVGEPVFSMAIHGDIMLVGQANGGIHIIDRKARKEIRHLKYHDKGVFDIAYNPLHNHYYSTGGGGTMAVLDGENFDLIMQIPLSSGKVRRLLLSPNNEKLIVTASDGNIHVIDTGYFNQLQTIHGHTGGTYAAAWMSTGTQLVTGGRDAHLRIWDFDNDALKQTQSIPAHNYAIYDILPLSANSFASAARDRNAKIWNTGDLKTPQRLISDRLTSHNNSVNTLAKTEDYLITAGDDRIIKIWDLNSGA